MSVTVTWVPSERNRADVLTRVPNHWLALSKKRVQADVTAAAPCLKLSGPISRASISAAQRDDEVLVQIVQQVVTGEAVTDKDWKRGQGHLLVEDGILYRQHQDPVEGKLVVPVIPRSLQEQIVSSAHTSTGHGSWEVTWHALRKSGYFPGMAAACQSHVKACGACQAATPAGGNVPPSDAKDVPVRPWDVVQVDTLELGEEQGSTYHNVLVCVDAFTRWAEVIPLARHDGRCVAEAFLKICCRFGPPRVVRSDNGKEFCNYIVEALFEVFGIVVRHGAVRHPQSQGAAERFNRTLLTMIRKTIQGRDWKQDLDLLLFYYRTRYHTSIGMSPMMAMCAWEPRDLLVEEPRAAMGDTLGDWAQQVRARAAQIRDYVSEELVAGTTVVPSAPAPYKCGDTVLLRRPARRQKRLAPFEAGWVVEKIVSPTTVVIRRAAGGQDKVVNVELLKLDVGSIDQEDSDVPKVAAAEPEGCLIQVPLAPEEAEAPTPGYALRDRSAISVPSRYRD